MRVSDSEPYLRGRLAREPRGQVLDRRRKLSGIHCGSHYSPRVALQPNNPATVSRGQRQLEIYQRELQNQFPGRPWTISGLQAMLQTGKLAGAGIMGPAQLILAANDS